MSAQSQQTTAITVEPIIEPNLPIVDAHHHLWFMRESALMDFESHEGIAFRDLAPVIRSHAHYLLDEYLAHLNTGHNIRASVFCDSHAMYRRNGAEAFKSVGEVEFANGIAAMAASGTFGDIAVCAGIVGGVDLREGDAVEEVLRAHVAAGGERYRGVRATGVVYDEDAAIMGAANGRPHVLLDKDFRAGFRWLQPLGLSFDALVFEPQLSDVLDLAHSFPDTQIILNHLGAPLGVGRYTQQKAERFPIWRKNIQALARCENVTVKLGGLGNAFCGGKYYMSAPPAGSAQLADEWKPYIETCIEAFGARRCMFESNFPLDASTCTYAVLWNAFKRLTAGATNEEKAALFSGTAMRIYRLAI